MVAWYMNAARGSSDGGCAASWAATASWSSRSTLLKSVPGSRAWWDSTSATVIASFPAAPKSGQYLLSGASSATTPRSTSSNTAAAARPLVPEKISWTVSSAQGASGRA